MAAREKTLSNVGHVFEHLLSLFVCDVEHRGRMAKKLTSYPGVRLQIEAHRPKRLSEAFRDFTQAI
jgi:hypothetical protein